MEDTGSWLLLAAIVGVVSIGLYEFSRRLAGGRRAPTPRLLRPLLPLLARAAQRVRDATDVHGPVASGMERIGVVRRPPTDPLPPVLLVLELRRLGALVRQIDSDGQPHPAARLAAARAAYDHVLVQLCGHAEVPTPIGLLPLDPRDRLVLETQLAGSGVDW